MRVVGYARVSTDKQVERGISLESQVEKIRAMALLQSAELTDVIVDGGESAKSLERPGLQRIMGMVDGLEVDAVVVAKLDRLTRSVKDLADLLERFNRCGVALISISESLDTQSAAGRLVLNIMTAVSQWEREAIGERTRDAMRFKKAQGERVGNIPFGYQLCADGKHVEPNIREQRVLVRIRSLRKSGSTLRQIADELNRANLKTRRGSDWRHVYVAGLLQAAA
jgi:site-specific DNA recombinase